MEIVEHWKTHSRTVSAADIGLHKCLDIDSCSYLAYMVLQAEAVERAKIANAVAHKYYGMGYTTLQCPRRGLRSEKANRDV